MLPKKEKGYKRFKYTIVLDIPEWIQTDSFNEEFSNCIAYAIPEMYFEVVLWRLFRIVAVDKVN